MVTQSLPHDSNSPDALMIAKPKRPPAEYSKGWGRLLLALDVVSFVASSYFATTLTQARVNPTLMIDRISLTSAIVVIVWLALFQRVGLYRRSFALTVKDEFYYTVAALCLGVLPLFILFTIIPDVSSSRVQLGLTLAFAIAIDGVARASAHLVKNSSARKKPRRIALVGRIDRIDAAADALDLIAGTAMLRIPVDNIDATVTNIDLTSDSDLDNIPWLHEARDWGCDMLLLTEMLPPFVMPHLLEVAARSRIKVAFAPPRVQTHAYSLSLQRDGRQALIVPARLRACTPGAQLLKRWLDIAVALSALIVFSPIMAIIALAVLIDSGKPIFYRQERVGQGGKLFKILKFRSMPNDAEAKTGPVWTTLQAGKRTTRIGGFLRRTSLDELPQLFNVLHGEMSVVGPRPERPLFVNQFRQSLPRYDERHLVRPGITGWSHIHMKRNHDQSQMGERLAYDLFYVEHWSLFMDISIVFKTAAEVFFHKAA